MNAFEKGSSFTPSMTLRAKRVRIILRRRPGLRRNPYAVREFPLAA